MVVLVVRPSIIYVCAYIYVSLSLSIYIYNVPLGKQVTARPQEAFETSQARGRSRVWGTSRPT